jgi:hypothetical protein
MNDSAIKLQLLLYALINSKITHLLHMVRDYILDAVLELLDTLILLNEAITNLPVLLLKFLYLLLLLHIPFLQGGQPVVQLLVLSAKIIVLQIQIR